MDNRFRSFGKASVLLAAPLLFLFLHSIFSFARGPFYLAVNYDPEYAYLFNGLNLISGLAPDHVDHPGIPLHLFTAVFIKLMNIGSSDSATIESVLAHPEACLKGLNAALMMLYFIAQWLVGIFVWRKTGSTIGALLLQATPFLLADDFVETVRFRPELMILFIALVMSAALYVQSLRDGTGSQVMICLFGFLAATGLATKINFLPLVLLPLFALRTWKNRAAYLGWVSLFVALWSLLLLPHYHSFISLIGALATRQGHYGTGDAALFGARYPEFLMQFVLARPIFFSLFALSLFTVVYTIGWRWNKAVVEEKRLAGLLFGLILAQFLEYLMAAKFAQGRYLMPAVAFSGLNCALSLALVRHWQRNYAGTNPLRRIAPALGVLVFCWSAVSLRDLHARTAAHRDRHESMARSLESCSRDEAVIYSYGCSSLYHALWFGNTYAGRRYNRFIESQFPNRPPAYHVEEWTDKTFWISVAPPHEPLGPRLKRGETLLLAAQRWPWPKGREREFLRLTPTNASFNLEPVRLEGDEALYRVKAIFNGNGADAP